MTSAIVTIFSSCRKDGNDRLDADKIVMLKENYNSATINYLYETVFHEDEARTNRENVNKWTADPRIVLTGNPSDEEVRYVKEAISTINGLNLSIKCKLERKADTNVIEIFFGEFKYADEYLKTHNADLGDSDSSKHLGIAQTISYDGIISKAYIGVFYNEKDTLLSLRRNIVLEEIVQSLGITGDSYAYPQSLFFQNYNPSKTFTQLDQNVLSLLYDPAIPVNYSRKSFESDFADVLYPVHTKKKIQDLLLKSPKEFSTGNELAACFTEGELLKHPREVPVYLTGSVEPEDIITLKMTIASINKISPNLAVKLSPHQSSDPAYGIVLNLTRTESQKESIKRTVDISKGMDCMFPKLIKSKIVLSFNGSARARKFRNQSIIDAVYFSLIQLPQEWVGKDTLYKVTPVSIEFNEHYSDLLKIIYSNEFVDGLKLSDFNSIKSSIHK